MVVLAAVAGVLSIFTETGRAQNDQLALLRFFVPQVADGGSWSTSIFLFNPRAYAASTNVSFRDDNGLPLQIPFPKDGVPIFSATIDIALPPFGSAEIVTSGLSPTVTQGYAVVLRKIGSMLALASFRQRIPGRPDFEATLPAELPTAAINACPFDNTNGFSTGIALLNPDSIPAQYVLSFYDSNGISVTEQLITLRSLQKSAFDSASQYRDTAGKRGVFRIRRITSATGPSINYPNMGLTVLRFNPTGRSVSTTLRHKLG